MVKLGKVEKFYFDDRGSTIRHMLVKLREWFSGKKVLILPDAFQKSEWESKMFLQSTIKKSL